MSVTRKEIRAALSKDFVPALKKMGYTGPNIISGNKRLHEYLKKTPFGVQYIFIQLEKYHGLRFIFDLEHQ